MGSRWLTSEAGQLRYSTRARFFALFMSIVPPLACLVLLALQERPMAPGEWFAFAFLLLLFPVLSAPLLIEFHRVAHWFDESGWDYRSPWSPHRRLDWSNVARARWRPAMKWLDFHTDGATFHLSPMIGGLEGFARVALDRIPAAALDRDPEVLAALLLMAHGYASALVTASLPPTALVSQLLGVSDQRVRR